MLYLFSFDVRYRSLRLPGRSMFIFSFHSKFDVGRSMFDVHLFPARFSGVFRELQRFFVLFAQDLIDDAPVKSPFYVQLRIQGLRNCELL